MTRDPSAALDSAPTWRGAFENAEVNALHATCFDHRLFDDDWWSQVNQFSLGWVCLRRAGALIGFVNVAWDGGLHAFILDTMVLPAFQRQGLAKALVAEAVDRAKRTGCEWLHVDFEPRLRSFYFDACGFAPTEAGLIPLK
ncbi:MULTISPECIES: GNAT family N-acetyltransferase [unclassified Sphingomonas]|uniref:GNAT family N-acetyltransferase n=1 Tax=unclassified Sphingomonas TaxID=196159 RepID=UPI0006FF5BA7|nr:MULTISPECIES: GNAT family N-acetyltransferase [unclassified Sphingomonas]KQX25078.1 acetyltransferase [Sphingomonas sp. Root1294]KQY66095.1 acetyltransferase [Sphingomonas sp. Root50]KRB89741.1 acetyltransferase [Sphingomonas sp. Root720]